MTAAPSRVRRAARYILGERPTVIFYIATPTLLAIAIDFLVRPRALLALGWIHKGEYVGSAWSGVGFVSAQLWFVSRLFLVQDKKWLLAARAALVAYFLGVFFPIAFMVYGGQPIFYKVYNSYISRDTVRLGLRLQGTVFAWLESWGAGLAWMTVVGLLVTLLVAVLTRRAAPHLRPAGPFLPIAGFLVAAICLWNDAIESRGLQSAPPDACFLHGAVFAFRARVTKAGGAPKGVTLRKPDPLPKLEPAEHRPNVVVILTESVRADAMCSDKRPGCDAPFLNEAAPDRIALGTLTTQSSGTFTSCMMLWTGLPPDVDLLTAHRAAMLWEVARAVGYRTGYLSAQNLRYQDIGVYLQNAGIDVKAGAADLGDAADTHIGAPDERATGRALDFIRTVPEGTPYFALVHLSNTHWPYRVDPALQPFEPHDADPLAGREKLHNHYRNSVRMQERTVADFIRALRAGPCWDDTAVIFLSDHGETFREHGRLYHLNNVFDEEVRIPGWILAGPKAMNDAQRSAVRTYADKRTYSQDVNATIVDLFGVHDQRPSFPLADRLTGRSLLRPRPPIEVAVTLSTQSGVWEDDDPVYGVRRGDLLIVGTESRSWDCYDSRFDPGQHKAVPLQRCASLAKMATDHFPEVPKH